MSVSTSLSATYVDSKRQTSQRRTPEFETLWVIERKPQWKNPLGEPIVGQRPDTAMTWIIGLALNLFKRLSFAETTNEIHLILSDSRLYQIRGFLRCEFIAA